MNPDPQTLVGIVVRTALAGVGGGLIADGTLTADQFNTLAGGLTVGLVALWSLFQKRRMAKKLLRAKPVE